MPENFSDRLLAARVAKNRSQAELASVADIAPAQISRYEAGLTTPRPHVMARLAGALGVQAKWLQTGEGPRESGSTTAFGKRLDVTTSPGADGGLNLEVAMDEESWHAFEHAANTEGLSVDEWMIKSLMTAADVAQQSKAQGIDKLDMKELARRVFEVMEADRASNKAKSRPDK